MDYIYMKIAIMSIGAVLSFLSMRFVKYGFCIALVIWLGMTVWLHYLQPDYWFNNLVFFVLPLLLVDTLFFAFVPMLGKSDPKTEKYRMELQVKGFNFQLQNILRGISIIGAAGSGKTESVIYNILQHLRKNDFCGVIHDYKDFELTEIVFPLFRNTTNDFYIISFDPIYNKVNPIAPKYLPDEESVNEISRVLLENLLELRQSGSTGSSQFFNDAVEGLISGLIWRLKTDYPDYCTIPHLIAIYQYLDTKALAKFLSADLTAKAMANAFINGIDSEKQTAGVRSTLANAFKKISTRKIFMVLSGDDIPLNLNNEKNPAVVSIVNNPKIETSLSPVIAAIMHTITKQMSVRHQLPSFVIIEEASTIRLLNMHRIPATLRSFNIASIYVLQDKIQNDMLYGEKASKAILSNLSYQFFGKANDPDTAKYYERFFEIVKKPTRSINKGFNLNFDTRVTHGEKEVAKTRADKFFGLKPGEFIVFADGKDKRVQFKQAQIKRSLPPSQKFTDRDLEENFIRIHGDIKSIFTKK